MNNTQPVFPTPRQLILSANGERLTIERIVVEGDHADRAREIVGQLGLEGAGGPAIAVRCQQGSGDHLDRDPVTGFCHGEGYRIVADDDGTSALLEFATVRGMRFGLTTIAGLLRRASWTAGLVVEDAPRFPIRGLIEGYYGPPWSPRKRHEILSLMAGSKMNAYFYGPKDDLYHRELWRDVYPPDRLEELRTAFATATDLDMDFWYTIGPGLSMAYSNEDDIAALEQKLLQISELGVTCFGLLYDDIPEHLQHDSDIRTFDSLPEAHALVANRIFRFLSSKIPAIRFAICPTQYFGAGNEPYITRLGGLVDPRIEMFWTGPEICSRELTLRDAALLERTISRPVLYWDNYPVNDCEMVNELHIGPYRGRDPHLYRAAVGVVANGMEYPESSKIGLMTVADYLWNPEAYDPEASWDYALRTVVGEDQWERFKIFADNNRFSALYQTDSPYLTGQLHRAEFLRSQGRGDEATGLLRDTVTRLETACDLFDTGLENTDLSDEIGRWISKYRIGVELLKAKLEVETTGTSQAREALARAGEQYAADRTYVFADVLNSLTGE